jgi:hypothetical protein
MGFSMAMQYEIKGNKVIVGYQGQMVPTFQIVDSKTLQGITMGMADSYRKQD